MSSDENFENNAVSVIQRLEREKKQLQAEMDRKDKALDDIIYRLRKMEESLVLRRKIIQRNNWIVATREIAEQVLKGGENGVF